MREAEKGARVAAGGDGGLFRLRWPDGCLEVAETAGISPAGVGSRLGFSRGRVWSPDAVGEAEAAAARRNKSSRTLPRPSGALLRRHRRVRGGGAPDVERLYRSHPPAARRPFRMVSSLALSFVDGEAARVCAEVWGVERIFQFCGGVVHRRRISLQGRRGSGCVPGRCFFSVRFILPTVVSVYCGSSQSLIAMELRLAMGWWRTVLEAAGDGRRRRNRAREGSWVLYVISALSRGLCVRLVEQSSVSYSDVPVLVFVLYS